jgi:hypothetical protein
MSPRLTYINELARAAIYTLLMSSASLLEHPFHSARKSMSASLAPCSAAFPPDGWPTELDARGPTQPKPLKALLVALQEIPPGVPQYVRTRERPTDLVDGLARHGIAAEAIPLPDTSWRLRVVITAT